MNEYRCPACGRQFDHRVPQCPQCGAIMSAMPDSVDTAGIKRKFLILFVVLAVLCAVAIVLLPR